MREVVLDTETTGLDPAEGHRIVEVGCVELEDHVPTGRNFQSYVDPERDIPAEATRISGIDAAKLKGAPVFAAIADGLLAFLGDAPLVIHNAEFDIKFLNAEFARIGKPILPPTRAVDTIEIAKRKFPGARYSLDELCRRFGIDLGSRTLHGALIDAELTAQVYLELIGGRQTRLQLGPGAGTGGSSATIAKREARIRERALAPRLNAEEREAHARFIAAELEGDVLWRRES